MRRPEPPPAYPEPRVLGCLAGLAVGNVLALAVESRSREEAQLRLGSTGHILRLPLEEAHCPWDDDLAMAMSLAGCLAVLPLEALHLDTEALTSAYLGWLRSGSRGIGGLTREVLTQRLCGDPQAAQRVWEQRCARGQRPLGNGAAMRVAPIGMAFAGEPERILHLASEDAAITHWDPACRQSASLIALLVAAHIRGERAPLTFALSHAGGLRPEVAEAFRPLSLEELATRRLDGGDMGSTLLALQVCVSLLASGLPYPEALCWVLRQGGDTDTNGAIVGAILGARDGLEGIPGDWRACVADFDRILETARLLGERSRMPKPKEVQ